MNGTPEAQMSGNARGVNRTTGTEKSVKENSIIGERFGGVTVLSKHHQNKENRWKYLCRCDCGNTTFAYANQLKFGHKISCGCLIGISHTTHGLTKTKEYRTWKGIKGRCYRKNQKDYSRYGAKGIKVCDRWINSFENFFEDMGKAPSPRHQIDRIDNTGDYSPTNCKWSTPRENACNKCRSKIWHIKGLIFDSAISAATHFGVHESTVWAWCTGKNRTRIRQDCYFVERYPDDNSR